MNDFETHPVGYVAHLKQRIFELEQGGCRFNCRTEKQAFIAGYYAASEVNWDFQAPCDDEMAERAHKEWKDGRKADIS